MASTGGGSGVVCGGEGLFSREGEEEEVALLLGLSESSSGGDSIGSFSVVFSPVKNEERSAGVCGTRVLMVGTIFGHALVRK